jgi:hypothetical protein
VRNSHDFDVDDVLVVSIDRLIQVLRRAVGVVDPIAA